MKYNNTTYTGSGLDPYASDGSDLWLDALELALSDLSLCIVNVDGMLA
jgi:hypothetical protein